jgi:formylglycine-generating enzyme required for sulfatase activity
LKVFAIEMVLIPGGSFWVGDGVSTGTFRQTGSNTPVQISSLATVIKCQDTNSDDAQLEGAGIWISGVGGISRTDATATNINPDFPTGFTGFYCMKYELSQGQYRDFLNTLTRAQQNLHTTSDISGTSVDNRYVMTFSTAVSARNSLRCDGILPAEGPIEIYCDLDGDGEKNEIFDGEWLACNYISWTNRSAYLDWSGLRPMTELEFEKACRGPVAPVAGEYPWGTTAITNTRYTLSNPGTAFEGIAQGYSTTAGNAYYSSTHNVNSGTEPLRVGIFSAHSSNNGRVASGAGYYGVMELGGNMAEPTISIGDFSGRLFTGINGDGELASNGEPNVSQWPGPYLWVNGLGHRAAPSSAEILRTSNRFESSSGLGGIGQGRGLRGCRSVPVNGSGY